MVISDMSLARGLLGPHPVPMSSVARFMLVWLGASAAVGPIVGTMLARTNRPVPVLTVARPARH